MIFKIIYTIVSVFIFSISVAQTSSRATNSNEINLKDGRKLTYKIINSINNTFGYDIYADDKMIIHQPSIPALSGKEGFKTKIAAENIAQLVISKIKQGEMPPSVTIEEIKKLKAIP